MPSSFPKMWNLLDTFKDTYCLNNWKTCKNEDWIKTKDGKYHNFLWARSFHPSTFEKIVTNKKCAIQTIDSYKVVNVSYIAWLFQDEFPKFLTSWIKIYPEIASYTALYDFAPICLGKEFYRKYNKTRSVVYQKFEEFLKTKWNLESKLIEELPPLLL